ncbi:hypothetical protein M231_05940 [Tremella mesenterica]|uniref:Uncharacterized protein n=1 Tax=Tremella mesenterica TaxID=5217 RepID=A0A4Q1BGS5_TREME|nr:hypothetical protein M231_05940 [Tremella mesenterica]
MRSLRAFSRLITRPTSTPLLLPPVIPIGPSCSRWFSCQCCHRNREKDSFFTPNPDRILTHPNNLDKEGATKPPRRAATRETTGRNSPEKKPSDPPIQPLRLPLPPKLPYSPDSLPFQRHCEALSQSLQFSPNDSWLTFLALDPSLRRYIPDHTYRSLLSHQLTEPDLQRRQNRSRRLINFAGKCGMQLSDLGRDNLMNTLHVALTVILTPPSPKISKDLGYERNLWNTIKDLDMNLRSVPEEVRLGWLEVQARWAQSSPDKRDEVGNEVLEIIQRDGAEGSEQIIMRIIKYLPVDQSLQIVSQCWTKNIEIEERSVLGVMERFLDQSDSDSLRKLVDNLNALSTSMSGIRTCLEQAISRNRSPQEKLATVDRNSIPSVMRRTLKVVKSMTINSVQEDLPNVLSSLSFLLGQKAECYILIHSIFSSSQRLQLSSSPTLRNHFLPFLQLLHESHQLEHLEPHLIFQALRTCISSLPSSEAYILGRRLYSQARISNPPFQWTKSNVYLWKSLFHHALSPPRPHLHFASRLYADLQADGMKISSREALFIIRIIAGSTSPSRAILLDRHLKDYLWTKEDVNPLVEALVKGLTSTKNMEDTVLALNLSLRILQDKPLPLTAAENIARKLSQSSRPSRQQNLLQVLRLCSGDVEKIYEHCLFSIIVHRDLYDPLDRQKRLGRAIILYKEMLSRNIRPGQRSISLLIRLLLDTGHLESALAIFKATLNTVIKSGTVGRLMISLALEERYAEADEVERSWREAGKLENGKRYDKGVLGARILVDIKQGKVVDMIDMERKGWKGGKYFLKYLESLKSQAQAQVEVRVRPPTMEIEKEIEMEKIKDGVEDHKMPIRPITRSLWVEEKEKEVVDMTSVAEVYGT